MSKTLIDPNQSPGAILGITDCFYCPLCMIRGRADGPSKMMERNDGCVHCATCGQVSEKVEGDALFRQPSVIRDIVVSLISGPNGSCPEVLRLAGINSGGGHVAVDEGQGPDDILTSIALTSGEFADVRAQISYTGNDLKCAEMSSGLGSAYNVAKFGTPVPEWENRTAKQKARTALKLVHMNAIAQKLADSGFWLVAANLDGARRWLSFVKGYEIKKNGAKLGIRAQITWDVC